MTGIPDGWAEMVIDGKLHFANFAKEFINVIRTKRESETNVLGDILRSWFGPDAGLPGTRFEVEFRRDDGRLEMIPVRSSSDAAPT